MSRVIVRSDRTAFGSLWRVWCPVHDRIGGFSGGSFTTWSWDDAMRFANAHAMRDRLNPRR